MDDKAKVIEQYPTARAVKGMGGVYVLDGVHKVFEVTAVTELIMWAEVWKCVQKWPDAHARYRLKVEHFERLAARNHKL